MLGGKPLIIWSVDVAKQVSEVCDILVSTDDPAIGDICLKAGALVPWLRPANLANDTASSVDVALHALDWYETQKGVVDGILLLQPTSPFRTRDTLRKGIELFRENDQKPVVGISPANEHPMWTLKMEGDHLVPFMDEHGLEMQSQSLPAAYVVTGSFYLICPSELRARHSFIGVQATPLLITSPQEALDIDTPWDFKMAEVIAESMHDI